MYPQKTHHEGDRVKSICSGFYYNCKGTVLKRAQVAWDGQPHYVVQLDKVDRPQTFKWNWIVDLPPEQDKERA